MWQPPANPRIGTVAPPGPLMTLLSNLLGTSAARPAELDPLTGMPLNPPPLPTLPAPQMPGWLKAVSDAIGIGQGPSPTSALFSSAALPGVNNLQQGLGLMAALASQSETPALPPPPPLASVGPTVANAARAVLPERSPITSMLPPALPQVAAVPGATPGTAPALPNLVPQAPTQRSLTFGGAPAVDPLTSYMQKTRSVESGGNDNAQNPNSSAGGRYQFIDSTWIGEVRRQFPDLVKGLGRDDILALKANSAIQDKVMEGFTKKNEAVLTAAGQPVTDATRYLAHFLGANGAVKLLSSDPSTPIKSVVGDDAYNANLRKGKFVYGETAGDVVRNIQARFGTTDSPVGSGVAFPGAPTIQAPTLPAVPTLAAPPAVDTSGYAAELEKARPKAPDADNPTNRLMTLLGGMAAGAAQSKGQSVADVIAKAGAGASGAVQADIDKTTSRRDWQEQQMRQFQQMLANGKLTTAQLEQQGKAGQVATSNQNLQNTFQRDTQQATLDVDAKNKNMLANYERAEKVFTLAMPKATVGADGQIVVQQMDPEKGTLKLDMTSPATGGYKALQELHKLLDDGRPETRLAAYAALAKQFGQPAVHQAMVGNLVKEGGWKEVMQSLGKGKDTEFVKRVEDGLTKGTIGTNKYGEAFNARAMALLWGEIQTKPELFERVLQEAAKLGDPLALQAMAGRQTAGRK